jgi:hypothetical protein
MSDPILVANLKQNVRSLQAALDRSEHDVRVLTSIVLELLPFDTIEAFGAVVEFNPTPQALQRAQKTLDDIQKARTGDGVVVTAYDPQAKYSGKAYDPKQAS